MSEGTEYLYRKLQEEHDQIIIKLADIRSLFDESDEIAEGHDIVIEMVESPYMVAVYTENKLKRLMKKVERIENENSRLRKFAPRISGKAGTSGTPQIP
jgi:hypothetical protein